MIFYEEIKIALVLKVFLSIFASSDKQNEEYYSIASLFAAITRASVPTTTGVPPVGSTPGVPWTVRTTSTPVITSVADKGVLRKDVAFASSGTNINGWPSAGISGIESAGRRDGIACHHASQGHPRTINFTELRDGLEKASYMLIDVRNPEELEETGMIPWSFNLPLPEVKEAFSLDRLEFLERYRFPKPLPDDDNVVLSCRSGRRAQTAWKQLQSLGYCKIRLYLGSFLDWKEKGGPLLPYFRPGL